MQQLKLKYLMFLYKRRAGSIIFNFAVDNKYANVCCRQKERNGKETNRGEYSHEIRKTKNLLGKTLDQLNKILFALRSCVCESVYQCMCVCMLDSSIKCLFDNNNK